MKNCRVVGQGHTAFGTILKNGMIAPLPDWGAKDLKLGTLRAVIRQLGLDWKEFTESK